MKNEGITHQRGISYHFVIVMLDEKTRENTLGVLLMLGEGRKWEGRRRYVRWIVVMLDGRCVMLDGICVMLDGFSVMLDESGVMLDGWVAWCSVPYLLC